MRHIIEFRVVGDKGEEDVLALSNDGRLYLSAIGTEGVSWGALPALPQDGFDGEHTIAAESGRARAAQTTGPIMEVLTKLQQMLPAAFGSGLVPGPDGQLHDPSCPDLKPAACGAMVKLDGPDAPPVLCGKRAVFVGKDIGGNRCAECLMAETGNG